MFFAFSFGIQDNALTHLNDRLLQCLTYYKPPSDDSRKRLQQVGVGAQAEEKQSNEAAVAFICEASRLAVSLRRFIYPCVLWSQFLMLLVEIDSHRAFFDFAGLAFFV